MEGICRTALGLFALVCVWGGWPLSGNGAIKPSLRYPWYWEYRGGPIVLLGGSTQDNLFQLPDVEQQLDLMVAAGGNYVRNAMSGRDPGNLWPFAQRNGRFDLEIWNEEYWSRLSRFLDLCLARNIIVQIEIWATWDFYREAWTRNPFNPRNNANYTRAESGLPHEVSSHPTQAENPFFFSTLPDRDNLVILPFQRRFVDKLLSHTLSYPNILYCIDNETSVTPEWPRFWAGYIRERARQQGVAVQLTEMWEPHDLEHPLHANTFDAPELFSYAEISQNNHLRGQAHWDQVIALRERFRASGRVRPMNNVKIYGGEDDVFGTLQDGVERFWRNIFVGAASARFHRPPTGLGLSPAAQVNLAAMRSLLDRIHPFASEPRNDLLAGRQPNEAYCFADPGRSYAVYFPDTGAVEVHIDGEPHDYLLDWLDIASVRWRGETTLTAGDTSHLAPPGSGQWVALIRRNPVGDQPP